MELFYPVQKFIEDHIVLIEENELTQFLYNACFALLTEHTAQLREILQQVLNINIEDYLQDALVEWCKDNVGLQKRAKVPVSKLVSALPHFGYDNLTFTNMLIGAVTRAYPNKVLLPDSYGISYIVERT